MNLNNYPTTNAFISSNHINGECNYFAISRESKTMQFFETFQEMKDSLAGDLDIDWEIFRKTSCIEELEKIEAQNREKRYLKNSKRNGTDRRFKKLGL
jgi:hypothetical protein